MDTEFKVKAYMMVREGEWSGHEITVTSRSDIYAVFSPYESMIDEVRMGDNRLYSSPLCHAELGVVAHAKDDSGDRHYLSTPLLFLATDGKNPVDITEDVIKTMKAHIDFF